METFFQICFGAGLSLILLNAVLGAVFGIVDLGIHFDFHLDLHFDLCYFLPLSPSLFFLFLTVFGGIGLVLYGHIILFLVLLIALPSAVAVNFIIWKFILKPLRKISEKCTPAASDTVGLNAFVGDSIEENGFGSIYFSLEGNTVSNPAKSFDGKPIESGTSVVILETINGVYIVERLI